MKGVVYRMKSVGKVKFAGRVKQPQTKPSIIK